VRGCGRGNRLRTLADGPTTRAPSLPVRPIVSGSFASRAFSRGVPLPVRPQRGLVGATQVFPRSPPDGAHGVHHALRRFHPADGWTVPRVASDAAKPIRVLRGSFSNSAFLPVRAHVSFVASRPTRFIFVGVTDRLLEKNQTCKSDQPGMSVAFDFWASLPSAVRFRGNSLAAETILPWALPLAGLSGT